MEKLAIAYFSKSPEIESLASRLRVRCPEGCTLLELRGHDVPRFEEGTSVLPLLVQKGGLWKSLCQSGARVAPPLLGSDEDLLAIASAFDKALPQAEDTCYLLVGHGEKSGQIAEHGKLAALLRSDIKFVTLKDCTVLPNAHRIVVVPFLLSYGHHARFEIARELVPRLGSMGCVVSLMETSLVALLPEVEEIFKHHLDALVASRTP